MKVNTHTHTQESLFWIGLCVHLRQLKPGKLLRVPMFAIRGGLCGWKHRHNFTPKWGAKSSWHKWNLLELENYHTGTRSKDLPWLKMAQRLPSWLHRLCAWIKVEPNEYSPCAGIQACNPPDTHTCTHYVSISVANLLLEHDQIC